MPEDFDGLVYDIGFGKYDHHQENRRVRKNGVPYAAFGLLWEEFGSEILGEKEAQKFDEGMKKVYAKNEYIILYSEHNNHLC